MNRGHMFKMVLISTSMKHIYDEHVMMNGHMIYTLTHNYSER